MTASGRDAVFRIILNVPFPLDAEEIKIQPSLARVNVNGRLDFRTEETSNSSETRLFSFFSPAKTIFASDAPANRLRRIANRAEAMTRILMRCLGFPVYTSSAAQKLQQFGLRPALRDFGLHLRPSPT